MSFFWSISVGQEHLSETTASVGVEDLWSVGASFGARQVAS
jgi:hypothetical protein